MSDPVTGETGSLTMGEVPPALAAGLLALSVILPEVAAAVGAEFRRSLAALPQPLEVAALEVIAGSLLHGLDLMATTYGGIWWQRASAMAIARLYFGYAPKRRLR